MSSDKVNDVYDEIFKSQFSRYWNNLETSMRGSDFIFYSVQLFYHKCHEVNFRRAAVDILILQTG